ncbi:MAG: NUDIX domain-containing protein [Candidatus Peregrinibacteria bacterium]
MEKRPSTGVSVILIDKDNILLGLRKGSHGGGTWGMPGGHIEWGESFHDCAIREIKEELGVLISCSPKPFHVTNDYFKKEDKQYITVFIVAQIKKGMIENREPNKCLEWKWFNYAKLPKKLFLPVENLVKQKELRELFIQ